MNITLNLKFAVMIHVACQFKEFNNKIIISPRISSIMCVCVLPNCFYYSKFILPSRYWIFAFNIFVNFLGNFHLCDFITHRRNIRIHEALNALINDAKRKIYSVQVSF